MRIILVTGKGGVGKTSVAAATAIRAARLGHRVLVTSTDPAHSLADAIDARVDDEPTRVAERLDAEQLDGYARLEEHWGGIRSYLVSLLEWGGLEEIQAEEVSLLPGLEEVFALIDLLGHARAGRYDLVVVDCAPTAETLRLLSLPDALAWYLERAFGTDHTFSRVLRPMLGRATSVPLPSDALIASAERLYGSLAAVRKLLLDGERATVRLVTSPERVVLAETRRTFTALHLFGYHVDAIVVNRLIPDEVTDPHFATWKARQAAYLRDAEREFGLPVLTAELADDEPVGVDALAMLASELHGSADPADVLSRSRPVRIVRQGPHVRLTLALPFAHRDEIDVFRRGDELHVRLGAHTRSFVLPAMLRRSEVVSAGLVDGALEVRFSVPRESGNGPSASLARPPAGASGAPADRGSARAADHGTESA